jgi:hypothetical protein
VVFINGNDIKKAKKDEEEKIGDLNTLTSNQSNFIGPNPTILKNQ